MAEKLVAFRTSALAEKLSEIQNRINSKIFEVSDRVDNQIKSYNFIEEILAYGEHICELALADFGIRLHDVAKDLDFDHPEINHFFSSFMIDDRKLIQFLKLCSLAETNNLTDLMPIFSKCMTKSIFPDIKTSLHILKNQQQFIRLFKNKEDRTRLRSSKTVRPIELSVSAKKLSGIWDNVTSLEVYTRFGNYYKDQIEKVTKRADVYKQLRLESMCAEILGSIQEFGVFEESYYGFQRISITIAAIVLAKMHNYTLDLSQCIKVPSSNFAGYDFIEGQPLCFVPGATSNSWTAVQKNQSDFTYMPMAYPLHTLEMPSRINKIVAHLEAFPEADGKPIFDQFIVVVPGIGHTWDVDGKFWIFDTFGKKQHFPFLINAKLALDTILIKEKYITPVLLGEKDGKIYFIGFWE